MCSIVINRNNSIVYSVVFSNEKRNDVSKKSRGESSRSIRDIRDVDQWSHLSMRVKVLPFSYAYPWISRILQEVLSMSMCVMGIMEHNPTTESQALTPISSIPWIPRISLLCGERSFAPQFDTRSKTPLCPIVSAHCVLIEREL